ncbi:ECF-type riboflavin transporter substrate-binding protein [Falsibacillus pallidus]|uniref:ECF-type riboflavin transporter substrate-binding protein n=1 Tax=Falsibacillus pallidus TaxID=493781 RepID=UPI003D95F1B1
MQDTKFSTKTIVAIGVGAAIFVILGRFVSIPSGIPNTTIETSYAFLALMALLFGPLAGALIGLIGHALKDAIFYGSPWWSWVVVSGFVGLFIGLLSKRMNLKDGEFGAKKIISFNIVQAVVQAVGWFLLAPVLDILVYAEPANKVFVQGIVAGLSNIVTVGVLGTLLIAAYSKTRIKSSSLEKEETL